MTISNVRNQVCRWREEGEWKWRTSENGGRDGERGECLKEILIYSDGGHLLVTTNSISMTLSGLYSRRWSATIEWIDQWNFLSSIAYKYWLGKWMVGRPHQRNLSISVDLYNFGTNFLQKIEHQKLQRQIDQCRLHLTGTVKTSELLIHWHTISIYDLVDEIW